MDLTPNLQFPFPGPDDTGDTALYLETLARRADSKMQEYRQAFNGYLRPPIIITTNLSTDDAVPNMAQEQHVLQELWRYTGSQVVYSNLPAGFDFSTGDFPYPGWWHFGIYKMSSVLVGGAANNAPTEASLVAYSTGINPGVETELTRVQRPYFESSTTGEHFELSGTVYVPAGAVVRASARVFHSMSGITRRFQTGCVGFRYYLGSGDVAQKEGF